MIDISAGGACESVSGGQPVMHGRGVCGCRQGGDHLDGTRLRI